MIYIARIQPAEILGSTQGFWNDGTCCCGHAHNFNLMYVVRAYTFRAIRIVERLLFCKNYLQTLPLVCATLAHRQAIRPTTADTKPLAAILDIHYASTHLLLRAQALLLAQAGLSKSLQMWGG